MRRYALFCFLGRGHLDPGLAIGRGLRAAGKDVTVCHIAIAEQAIRRADLHFAALDRRETTPTTIAISPRGHKWLSTLVAVAGHAARTLREAPDILGAARIEAVVADQLDVAAATVAEHMGLPLISLSSGPPLYLDESVPPPYFGWSSDRRQQSVQRNRRANALTERIASPLLNLINVKRREWKLPAVASLNSLFSTRGIITQVPACLELPRATPPHLFYTGQFRDVFADRHVPFQWDALDGRPLVYATMGTVRNTSPSAFRAILDACAPLDVQVVVSLGGVALKASDLGELPRNAVVVNYAPQRALIERAALTVCCAGMNTMLDSLWHGVPLVAIPVAEDQPGVAARIANAGVGLVIPVKDLSATGLRQAILAVLNEPVFRETTRLVQQRLHTIDGVKDAVTLIQRLTM